MIDIFNPFDNTSSGLLLLSSAKRITASWMFKVSKGTINETVVLKTSVIPYSDVLNTNIAINHAIEERILYFSLDSEEMNKRLYEYIDDKIRNDDGFMDMLRNTWDMIQLPQTIIEGNVDRLYTPAHKNDIDQKYAVFQGDTVAGYKWTVRNDVLKKIVLILRYDCEDHKVMIDPIV